jgi:hypothetical protein
MPLYEFSEHARASGPQDPTVAAAAARLTAEFAPEVREAVVVRVVLGSRRDLRGSPAGALPELVERLARQRLLQSEKPPALPSSGAAVSLAGADRRDERSHPGPAAGAARAARPGVQ